MRDKVRDALHGLSSGLIAVAAVCLAYLIQTALWGILHSTPFLLFYPAVFLVAWLRGGRPGVLATVLSAAVIYYRFLPSFPDSGSPYLGKWVSIGLFIPMGIAISSLTARMKMALNAAASSEKRYRELAQAHRALQLETAERFDLALNAGKIGIFEMDLRRPEIPVQWSHRQYEIFGVDPSGGPLTYEVFKKRIHLEDLPKVDREFEASIRERRDFNLIYRARLDDGGIRHVQSQARAIYDPQGRPIRMLGTNIDVSETVRAQETLQRTVKAREEMLAVVSHDLRNPLGSILMNVAMLRRKSPCNDGFTMEQATKIQRAGERMNEMIEDLLNIAKMEAGNFSLSKKDICGCDVVTEALEAMKPLADEKRIRIETFGIEQPLQMSCDHVQVLRVLSNLLANAIKFTPEGGLIRVRVEDHLAEVRFSISDTGPGIAEHHVPHIFERFWQASKTQHLGTGLGLAISKGIVEAHGGRIWVESKFGHGSNFLFTIPKAPVVERGKAA